MTEGMSPGRIRLGGAVVLIGGILMLGIGLVVADAVFGLPILTAWMPAEVRVEGSGPPPVFWDQLTEPAGLATLWLFAFAANAMVLGADMLIFARRSNALLWPLVGLIAIFVVAGVYATLQSGALMPRFGF